MICKERKKINIILNKEKKLILEKEICSFKPKMLFILFILISVIKI